MSSRLSPATDDLGSDRNVRAVLISVVAGSIQVGIFARCVSIHHPHFLDCWPLCLAYLASLSKNWLNTLVLLSKQPFS